MKDIGEVIIRTGDRISGDKVISIVKDPFVAGQIDIFVDHYDMNEFGDQERRVYRIQKEEEG